MRKILLLIAIVICVQMAEVENAAAQSTCAQTLRTARATYDQGRLHELPELLSGCLANGFTKQEKVEAYKLLVLAYLYLEEPTKADQAMLDLLRTDPYFEINPTADPAEFIALYKTFRTWPIYRIGLKVGVNSTSPNVSKRVEALDNATTSYQAGINFQTGITVEVPLSSKWTLNPELYFQLKNFQYLSEVPVNAAEKNSTQAIESMSWISLPVSLQYALRESKLNPYIGVGVSTGYLMSSSIKAQRNRFNANSLQERSFDVTRGRNTINVSAIASAGIKRRVGSGLFITELRVAYGLTTISKAASAYTLDDFLLYDYAYADNAIKLNSVSLTIGYIYNVFHPKKLTYKR